MEKSTPDPSVTIGKCVPFGVEMVIGGSFKVVHGENIKLERILCGVPMKDGMVENEKFDKPI